MVWQNNVVFKLNSATIEALIELYKDILHGIAAITEKATLQKEFVQVVNTFIYTTDVRVLEGLGKTGGELLSDQRENAGAAVVKLFSIEPFLYRSSLYQYLTIPLSLLCL